MPKPLGLSPVTSGALTGDPLTLRRLLAIYVPLALSWIMMAAEMPICTRFVNSLPDNRIQTAALLVLLSIALFIESPVIDLLATSTTLAKTRSHFESIRRFTVWLMAWTGVVHLLIAATPLFDFMMLGVLGQSREVAEAVRIPMLIMVPWSPAIGWRRHVQGVLIRNGVTKPIGLGTGVRVSTIIVVCLAGYLTHRIPGAQVAALALTSSVVAEAVFIHVAGLRALGNMEWQPEDETRLGRKELLAFHLPLTFSTMVMLTAMPATSSALGHSPDRILAMNSWQVSIALAFLLRTMTFALPEVVIANWRSGRDSWLLVRFCLGVGVSLSGLMLVLGFSGLDKVFFTQVTRADWEVANGAHVAFLACAALPTLTALTSYVKGVMTAERVTSSRLYATLSSVAVLVLILIVGVKSSWPGVMTAAMALTVSQFVELAILVGFVFKRFGRRAFLPVA